MELLRRVEKMLVRFVIFAVFLFNIAQASERDSKPISKSTAKAQLLQMGVQISSSALVDYAAQGDQNTVALLITAGLSASVCDQARCTTALHNAASQGHLDLARFLLSANADVNAQDWQGATPLIYAAYAGKPEVMTLLIAQDALVNQVPKAGLTPLNAAVLSGSVDAVKVLLDAGAIAEERDADGNTAIQVAERAEQAVIVKILRNASAAAQ